MVSELKKKEIITVKELVDAYKNSITEANKGLEHITEKYKKMMEEEKKSLKEQLYESKSMLKTWEKMFNAFDVAVVKEVLGEDYNTDMTDTDSAEEVDVTDDTVVDTLANDDHGAENVDEPEFDGAGFTLDDNEPPVANVGDEVSEQESDSKNEHEEEWGDDDMPADEESATSEKSEESDEDDDWADIPDDWK